jgi:hypothetical protein
MIRKIHQLLYLVIIIPLLLQACSPSESHIATAIAETQAVSKPPTSAPSDTPAPAEILTYAATPVTPTPIDPQTPEKGFYLIDQNKLISLIYSEAYEPPDFNSLPSTSAGLPVFSLQGDDYPLNQLNVQPYTAGIGVNVTFGSAGGKIDQVAEGSPAQFAGLEPGEIIVNGRNDRLVAYQPTVGRLRATTVMSKSLHDA